MPSTVLWRAATETNRLQLVRLEDGSTVFRITRNLPEGGREVSFVPVSDGDAVALADSILAMRGGPT